MSLKTEIKAFLGYLQNKYDLLRVPALPKGVSYRILGSSHERKEIGCYKIGTGPYAILFMSAIHGNEVGTVRFAHHLISWLHGQSEMGKSFSSFVIPCLNPDGYARACEQPDYRYGGREGRVNARGVDLNRNFDTPTFQSQAFWMHGKNYALKTEVFAGDCAASEPETQAVVSLINEKDIKLVISFHNAGNDVTGSADPLGQELAKLYADQSGYRFFPPDEWKALGQTGTMKEWCENHGVTYLEIESSSRWGSDWNLQRPAVAAVVSCLAQKNRMNVG